jgi:hypothetical protein
VGRDPDRVSAPDSEDDGRIDEILQVVTPQQIAETWVRYNRSPPRPDEPDGSDWWAIYLWQSWQWWEDEARVRDGLLHLVDAAETDDDLAFIRAGPLEVFISDDDSRVERIERHAAGSTRFRQALAHVWVWELPDKMFWRVQRASGSKLVDVALHRAERVVEQGRGSGRHRPSTPVMFGRQAPLHTTPPPPARARHRGGSGGVIVNVSSAAARLGAPRVWVMFEALAQMQCVPEDLIDCMTGFGV